MVESYSSGAVSSRDTISYEYDPDGIRVSALQETDANADGTFDSRTLTEYLVDKFNHTGYEQVLEETVTDADTGALIKKVVYTLGHDQISQTTFTPGGPTEGETLIFHMDGHGSTRVLTDLAAAVTQMFAFDAYGQLLAIHNATGQFVSNSASAALTSYLYSGEQFDSRIGQQYLRARYYDPVTGRFNRLDPFAGNNQDPQSLHKYLYAHANPVYMQDPTGNFGVAGFAMVMTIASGLREMKIGLDLVFFDLAVAFFEGITTGSPEKIWKIFLRNQIAGFLSGVLFGAAMKMIGNLWDNGLSLSNPFRRNRAGDVASDVAPRARRVAMFDEPIIFHNTGQFRRQGVSVRRTEPQVTLAVDDARIASSFGDPIQQRRAKDWADWFDETPGASDFRINQGLLDVDGNQVKYSNALQPTKPDIQFKLESGTYTLPNGAKVRVRDGNRRVYVELDGDGLRVRDHIKNTDTLVPDQIIVAETTTRRGVLSSLVLAPQELLP